MNMTIEIHPAEGGEDARLLVHDQAAIYQRYAQRSGLCARTEARGHL